MKDSPPSRLKRCLKALVEASDMVSSSADLLMFAVIRVALKLLQTASKVVLLATVLWILFTEASMHLTQQIARLLA